MSPPKCAHCHKHLAKIHPTYGAVWCDWCTGKRVEGSRKIIKEENSPSANIFVSNAPPVGSPRWYKEKWFRRTQKEWEKDIRSRVASPDGKVVRRING